VQKESVRNVIDRCRKLGTKTIAGGPLFTCSHEEFNDVDHLLLNEGELTLPKFISDLESGNMKHLYTSEEWADLSTTPVPLWELVNMNKYATMNMQYSRGCPFNCEFCNVTSLFGHNPRTKSVEQMLSELDAIYKKGWKGGVFFVDDNFIGNRRKLKQEILPMLIKWMDEKKYPFTFSTEASINLSDDDELMDLMVKAGFDAVFIGIETTNEESLLECNKIQNKNRDLIGCVKKIQKSGLQVQGGFIVGFDNDNETIFEKMVNFIQESGIVSAMVGLLNAPKGTMLYKRLENEGRLMKNFTGDNTDLTMNFIPVMNQGKLLNGYKSIIGTIYSPKYYYDRVMTFLKDFHPMRHKGVTHIRFSDIVAFCRSIFKLGIIGKERLYYWKLLIWSIFKRPRLLPMAVTFSIYGFHYRKIYEKC
jgi:Fe-S oxidoreductase